MTAARPDRRRPTASQLADLSLAEANRLYAGYFNSGHYAKSLPYALHALHLSEQQSGSRDATTAGLLANVGGVYQRLGRHAEAESLLSHAVSILRSELGSEHPVTINALNSLAAALIEQGDLEKGQAYLQQIVTALPGGSSEVQTTRAAAFNNLAAIHERRGDLEGAKALYEEALVLANELFGAGHPVSQDIRSRLARLAGSAATAGAKAPDPRTVAVTPSPQPTFVFAEEVPQFDPQILAGHASGPSTTLSQPHVPDIAERQTVGTPDQSGAIAEEAETTPHGPGSAAPSRHARALAAYREGRFEQAFRLWRELADSGDPRALFHLGGMAFDGTGTEADILQAYYWLSLSAAKGYAPAIALKERISPEMTDLQRDIAEEMLTEGATAPWFAQYGPAAPGFP